MIMIIGKLQLQLEQAAAARDFARAAKSGGSGKIDFATGKIYVATGKICQNLAKWPGHWQNLIERQGRSVLKADPESG